MMMYFVEDALKYNRWLNTSVLVTSSADENCGISGSTRFEMNSSLRRERGALCHRD